MREITEFLCTIHSNRQFDLPESDRNIFCQRLFLKFQQLFERCCVSRRYCDNYRGWRSRLLRRETIMILTSRGPRDGVNKYKIVSKPLYQMSFPCLLRQRYGALSTVISALPFCVGYRLQEFWLWISCRVRGCIHLLWTVLA